MFKHFFFWVERPVIVFASLITNKKISRLIIQFWCKDEDNPREEVLGLYLF